VLGEGGPLWWRDARRELPKEWLEEWDRKISAGIKVSRQQMGQIDYIPWNPGA
jgi:hypothetical protein